LYSNLEGFLLAISFIRTVIVFVTLLISMRMMGKRQLGELEPSELVVAVLIADLASHPLQDIGIPLIYGLIPVVTLLCCEVLVSGFMVKSIRFRKLVCGTPSVVVRHGVIVQQELKKNRFTLDELMEELRKKGVNDLSTVQYAVLETDGSLSTLLYAAEAPVTPKQMNLSVIDTGYPVIVINQGRVLTKNLKVIGKEENWLSNELKKRSIKSASDVFLMTSDADGIIYCSIREVST
jgi:uncharacterized membrane protein YcaP (DUF421 family)